MILYAVLDRWKIKESRMDKYRIIKISEMPALLDTAAEWFHSKWGIPLAAYRESMIESFEKIVPEWYLCLDGEEIAAGLGVIENDFHERKDLAPNVCAVYTEPEYRGNGIAGMLLEKVCSDMNTYGIDTVYLVTDHTGFYERYGWKFLCMVSCDGEAEQSRMYVHKR